MTNDLLSVENFSVSFAGNSVVDNISFKIEANKVTAVVGESGSGKSITSLSFLQLLPGAATVSGKAIFGTKKHDAVDLLALSKQEISKFRGNEISMIFQEPMTSLNPILTCGKQVLEMILHHQKITKKRARQEVVNLFEQVELPLPEKIYKKYPHEISGGQKQRVMIAMALSCRPHLLIADEPTTALDVRVQKSIIDLLKKLQARYQMAILFISHDLALVKEIADHIIVMQRGKIVEQGTAENILNHPKETYTKALLACRPTPASKGKKLLTVQNFLNDDLTEQAVPQFTIRDDGAPALSVKNLSVVFEEKKMLFSKRGSSVKVVNNVSFNIFNGEIVGLVGESGCGKTTLGRAILQLIPATEGSVVFKGKALNELKGEELKLARKEFQIVFQDPFGSLNPRLSIGNAIAEPLLLSSKNLSTSVSVESRVKSILEKVDLPKNSFGKYPFQFSGGQRQRICIARALAVNPSFFVFDESVSALDVSVQAQILNLIQELKVKEEFTALFISHDLAVVHYLCDRILVMKAGEIVEQGTADDVFYNPKHPYTIELLAAQPGHSNISTI